MQQQASHEPLRGGQLALGATMLAMANFLAILDTTIANVSVSNIAGSLGTSTSQGTYVITSYAVAEAISVPLTGWLAGRFGAIRVFVTCFILFGLFSLLCGMATSMNMLVLFRVFLGFCGGPLMPLSQTLMLRIFPKEKSHAAIGLWSMTTLVAPIMGPILGGILCDQYSWPYIFYVKAPFALLAGVMCWQLLRRFEMPTLKLPIDKIGLGLLIIWVAALQIMLDEGKDHDWFASPRIVTLAIIAAIGFVSFLIWELTERNPVVDLRVFRHTGFRFSMLTLSLGFGAFFGITVLTPLWLQIYMGYTATIAGYSTAMMGVLAVFLAPLIANLASRIDPRPLVFIGVVWGLLLFGKSLDFFAILGLLGLIGMNIKNAIVLVDEIGLQLKDGKGAVPAVVEATKTRIVPVTMASGTTILGMLPLLGDAMFAGMAATIMGGLFVSTVLTIFVLPVTYCIFFKIRADR